MFVYESSFLISIQNVATTQMQLIQFNTIDLRKCPSSSILNCIDEINKIQLLHLKVIVAATRPVSKFLLALFCFANHSKIKDRHNLGYFFVLYGIITYLQYCNCIIIVLTIVNCKRVRPTLVTSGEPPGKVLVNIQNFWARIRMLFSKPYWNFLMFLMKV